MLNQEMQVEKELPVEKKSTNLQVWIKSLYSFSANNFIQYNSHCKVMEDYS